MNEKNIYNFKNPGGWMTQTVSHVQQAKLAQQAHHRQKQRKEVMPQAQA